MVSQSSLLVLLVDLIDAIPSPAVARKRGRPPTYPDRLFLKALVIMLVRDVTTVDGLLAILGQPTVEMQALRERLTCHGQFPARRTWERRLNALPETLPARIACLGTYLVAHLQPWADGGAAVAIDSTALRARGGVWHKKDREAGVVPHTSIDTEAHWTKSGWHGWVYGWKLHLVVTVAAVWIPLAAELTPANAADNETAPRRLKVLPRAVRFVLGDTNYQDPALHQDCAVADRFLSPPDVAATRIPTTALRSAGCSTSSARSPSRTSTASSKTSPTRTARSRPVASSGPSASPSAQSSSINSPCSTASTTTRIFVSASKPS